MSQFWSVTGIGLRSIPARLGTSLVVVIGVAMVVAVFISVLAMESGFATAMANAGKPDRVVVLRAAADSEAASEISREAVATLRDLSGIRKTPQGEPVLSAEAMVFVALVDGASGLDSFVTLRGVAPNLSALRPELRIVEGRMFKPGSHELVVGRAVRDRMKLALVGSSVSLPEGDWPIVGVYESGGDARESEMLADAETLMSAYRKKTFNTVTVQLDTVDTLDALKADLAARPGLSLDVLREDEFIARSSGIVTKLLQLIAFGVGAIMAVGATFGAVNTMFTAVSTRSTEIGTLRALGFGSGAVVSSVLTESLVLAFGGALLGTALAWLFLNGTAVSVLSGNGPSQVTFQLHIDTWVAAAGIVAALAIGAIGGMLPAFRAGTVSIAEAVRRQ